MRFVLNTALLGIVLATAIPADVFARKDSRPTTANGKYGVPVFPDALKGRRYIVIGPVTAGVRKATVFSKKSSEAKIYRELWERAEKMGADAVINARYGDAHITVTSWGKTNATGTAIRFK